MFIHSLQWNCSKPIIFVIFTSVLVEKSKTNRMIKNTEKHAHSDLFHVKFKRKALSEHFFSRTKHDVTQTFPVLMRRFKAKWRKKPNTPAFLSLFSTSIFHLRRKLSRLRNAHEEEKGIKLGRKQREARVEERKRSRAQGGNEWHTHIQALVFKKKRQTWRKKGNLAKDKSKPRRKKRSRQTVKKSRQANFKDGGWPSSPTVHRDKTMTTSCCRVITQPSHFHSYLLIVVMFSRRNVLHKLMPSVARRLLDRVEKSIKSFRSFSSTQIERFANKERGGNCDKQLPLPTRKTWLPSVSLSTTSGRVLKTNSLKANQKDAPKRRDRLPTGQNPRSGPEWPQRYPASHRESLLASPRSSLL